MKKGSGMKTSPDVRWAGGKELRKDAPNDHRVITPVRGRAKGENRINKAGEIYGNNHLLRELEEEAISGAQSGHVCGRHKGRNCHPLAA